MDDLTRPPRAPSSDFVDDFRGLLRWFYTNNPFYAISAALIFYGLRSSFDTSGSSFQTGALMVGLTSYTLLLAAAAWFLIRFGNLWEDVRTLLLLVVLMLLAMSVSFDDALAVNSRRGIGVFLGGLAFAAGLSEALLHGIRLRLPAGFRVPYHACLALFFLYPVLLSPWIRDPDSPWLRWGLFAFPSAAGLVFLLLLPAVRRGPAYVQHNGSPWAWPWYPWVLFGVLGLGVVGRAYYLCIAFHFVGKRATIFGPYFLVPFLWVVNMLLLELAHTSGRGKLRLAALLMPAAWVALAVTAAPEQAADLGFLAMFRETLGASPLFAALWAAVLFYVLAMFRGVPWASATLALTLAALAFCGAGTFNPQTFIEPWGAPLLAAGAVCLALGLRRRLAAACLLGGWCLVLGPWIDYRATSFGCYRGVIPIHLLLAIALLVGAIARDAFGKLLQDLGAACILALVVIATTCEPSSLGDPPHLLVVLYPLLAASGAAAYGFAVQNPWYYASAVGSLGGWVLVPGWNCYRQARRAVVGLDHLVWGVVFFLVALVVSLSKMGIWQRPRPRK